jgi:RecA-family ATPase
VFYFNSEDDLDEIQRRAFATCQHYDIDKAELDGKLYIESGRSRELLLAVGNDGIINEPDFEYLEQRCKENHIGLLILDPLQNMHTAMETNEVFRNLGKRLSQLADDCNMSVEIIHHTRKISANSEATVENSRGGISLVAAVRSARLLNTMSRTESENIGLETNIDHFKIEPAGKNNLTRSLEKALWYQRSAVQLENGDWVAIVKKYNIPSAFDNISNSRIRDLYYSIKDTKINLMRSPLATRTEHKMSIHEFIGDFLQMDLEAVQTKSITKRIVKTWLDSKTLKEKTVDINTIDPNNYKKISTKIIVAGDVIPAVEI